MFKRLLAASLVIAMPSTACATTSQSQDLPATVVVAFDRDTITPLIVEGVRNRDTGVPVEANDPVRIASISKLIMALAALRLVEEGKVDLDADVSDYLGWPVRSPNFPDAKVTLAQLLSHRSGLRDAAGYVIPLGDSLKEKLAEPDAWHAAAAPGEAPFEYANLGSPVVATVLEAATGERYDAIIERTVFAPLGIEACLNWIGCSQEQIGRAVTLYRDTGEIARDDPSDVPPNCTIPVADGMECSLDHYELGTNASIFSPQGGVRIGMVDLAKIGQALMSDNRALLTEGLESIGYRWLQEERLSAELSANENEGKDFFCFYFLGMQAIDIQDSGCLDTLFGDGLPRLGHAGEAYGLRSGLWFHPIRADAGIAYFTTAVPPRQSAEDEGGFDPREIALMARAQALLADRSDD